MTSMHAVYGVHVASELALPAPLSPAGATPDLSIEVGATTAPANALDVRWFSDRLMPNREPWMRIGEGDDGRYLLRALGDADFWIDRDGRRIACHPFDDPSSELDQLVLDQILPLALHAAGHFVFHAAAVELDRGVVAMAGQSGAGKSTLAAWLSRRGAHFSDDCLRLRASDGEVQAYPGPACARLRPDSAAVVFGAPHAAETSGPGEVGIKQRVPLDVEGEGEGEGARARARERQGRGERGRGRARRAAPLRRIYLLGEASHRPQLVPVSPRDATAALARHLFRLDTRDRARLEAELELLTVLATRVPVRELRYPRRYQDLERVEALILADVDADSPREVTCPG